MIRSALSFFVLLSACSEYKMGTLDPEAGEGDTATPGLLTDTPQDVVEEDEEEEIEEPGNPEEPDEDPLEEEEDDCVESSTAFDIEQVSALQDAFGLPTVRDGLTLSIDPERLEDGRLWRPASVEVLVMYPEWFFEFYDDSNTLSVHFYDSAHPMGPALASRRLPIRKADFDWSALTLPPDADWSGGDREQLAAWVEFDLASVVGEDWLDTTDYFVALEWDDYGFPYVGYSNFELNCTQNWGLLTV